MALQQLLPGHHLLKVYRTMRSTLDISGNPSRRSCIGNQLALNGTSSGPVQRRVKVDQLAPRTWTNYKDPLFINTRGGEKEKVALATRQLKDVVVRNCLIAVD